MALRIPSHRCALGAVALAAGLALPPAAFGDALAPGTDLTATALPEGRVLTLAAPPGSYVAGEFTPSGSELVLRLQAADHALRELSRASAGRQSFHFVAPEAARLSISGPAGAAFALRLTSVIPPAAQITPATTEALLSPALQALQASLSQGGDTSAFWAARAAQGTPMIEDLQGQSLVTFLYRGAERNVRLFGGPSADHDWLARLGQSDVWFRSYILPGDTRLSYRLAPDIPDIPGSARARRVAILATAAADPLNPQRWPEAAPDAYNQGSVLELPGAPPQPGFPAADVGVEELQITSALLGNTRRLQLYRSPGYTPADPRALLLFVFDGPRAVADMQIPGALDNLVRAGRLPPLAAVFIDAIDSETRSRELPGNPLFARFMAEELLPFTASQLQLAPDPARTVVAGASFGGIGATHTALARPDLFGAAISLSGSYWWAPEGAPETALGWMAEQVLAAPRLPRIFLTAGRFETGREGPEGTGADIRETTRQLYAALRGRGAETWFRLYSSGHDSLAWRGALTEGLLQLYGQN